MNHFTHPTRNTTYAADLLAWKDSALAAGFDSRIVDMVVRQTIEESRNGITEIKVESMIDWVKCSERMPPMYERVLLSTNGRIHPAVYNLTHTGFAVCAGGKCVEGFSPAYWRYLPEAPEVGK
ncbi:MAG: DUF551 domain-containing protein [Proteobacteria bacterium]|nr:DUF551 domain-containing protein [Pseudomonadota bacterium]